MSTTIVSLVDNFKEAIDAVTGNMLMEAAKAGGNVIEGHAKVNASSGRPGLEIQTGNLVNSINVSEEKSAKQFAEVAVGPSNVIYAAIHEFGGIIVPLHAPMLSWVDRDTGERIFAKAVHIPARPYLRPAIDNNKDEIVGAVETELWRNLDRATR